MKKRWIEIKHQSVNSIGNYSYNRYFYTDTDFIPHFHKNYEFIYVLTGTASVRIGDKHFKIKRSETVLIGQNTIHSFKVDKTSKIWVGVFSPDFISLFAKRNSGKIFSPFSCDESTEEFLCKNLFINGESDIYILKSALYALCSQCKKNAYVLDISQANDIGNEILNYISENYQNDINLESVSKKFGYEPHYFSKLFHDMFAVNFKDMINTLRFEKACELLEKSKLPVTEIALASGFKSIRSFNRIFKDLSGKTPKEYCKDKE